jgi:hypothetical protein
MSTRKKAINVNLDIPKFGAFGFIDIGTDTKLSFASGAKGHNSGKHNKSTAQLSDAFDKSEKDLNAGLAQFISESLTISPK